MAKKKSKDVAKFGGVDQLGVVKSDLHRQNTTTVSGESSYDASTVEAKSETTHLEDDKGEGEATVIRCFTFNINLAHPEVWLERRPSKQELFNFHLRGIETAVWKDGLKIFDGVAPRVTFDTTKMQYSIFVAARPRNGYLLQERPQTLSEIAHG